MKTLCFFEVNLCPNLHQKLQLCVVFSKLSVFWFYPKLFKDVSLANTAIPLFENKPVNHWWTVNNGKALAIYNSGSPVVMVDKEMIFSWRFMKWIATIIVTLFFTHPHELTKLVLQTFYEILWCQTKSFGQRTESKKFFWFFRLIFSIGRDWMVTPFKCFWHSETNKKTFLKGPLFNFFDVRRQNGCWKIPKGPSFAFSAMWIPFAWKNLPFIFLDVLPQKCWKISKGLLFWRNLIQLLGSSGIVKEYLTLWCLFAIFEP